MTLITNHTSDDPATTVKLIDSMLSLAETLRAMNLESDEVRHALVRLARSGDFVHICMSALSESEREQKKEPSLSDAALAADEQGRGNGQGPIHILPPYRKAY